MLTLTLGVALALASQPPAPQIRPISVQGKVREIGGGPGGRPQALLVGADARHVLTALDPDLRIELRRLAGAVIEVSGVVGDPRVAAKDHVLVDRYEIIEIGKGIVPRVGRLAMLQVGTDRRLVFVDESGRADLLPEGWSRRMGRYAGAKVWIVGRRDKDGSFRPQRFSILRGPRKEQQRGAPKGADAR